MNHQLSKLLYGLVIGVLATSFIACSEKVAFNELESTERPFTPVAPPPPTSDDDIPPLPEDSGFFSKTQEVEVTADGDDVDILFVVDNSGDRKSSCRERV